MTKKFTEEQFKKLVQIQEGQYSDNLYFEPKSGNKAAEHVVERNNPELNDFINKNHLGNQAVALMNPLTRELAHDKYVEEEKKYVWTSKKPYYKDFYKRLYMVSSGLSSVINGIGIAAYEKFNVSEDEYLTETEVRNNGYNPGMFDKEEVD